MKNKVPILVAMCFSDHKDLARAARSVSEEHVAATVIELVGDVGTGKTTLTRGLAKGLGVEEEITSPSFTISKAYATKDGKTLVDDIVSFTNLKIFEVIPLLTSLEIKGVVVKSSGNEYTLAK